ncbi:MAG: MATE family efflux transporter [Burkholderiaceae bacterium]|nr:MATE family efflux transporter [Burkholderiaceae bacterium]MDO9089030.1 MATE family efflux transporter [Burkholderiaceae bacterium]MDP1969267.1 MATE family efflux transporter [Burkholderiaceae bacterium]
MFEFKTLTRHAGTVLVGQLAVMAFSVTDTIVAGRHSGAALAALSVGTAIFMSVFIGLMGVMQALLPVWAELHGARRGPELGRSVRQALYLCALTMGAGLIVLLFPGPVLRWTEVPEPLQAVVKEYLAVLACALPPALLFRIYGTLNQSLGKPLLVTWLQIGSLAVKVPLSIWFAFGGFGLEAHGVVGCAWATLVVHYTMMFLALWLLRTQPLYRPYRIWAPLERPDWHEIRRFARLGIPGGLAILVEVSSFTLMALFIARQGVIASASHQITSNLTAVLYMIPLSMAIATSARASYWLGARNASKARAAIRTGFKLTLMMALGCALLLLLARESIASIYAATPAVVALASALLAWGAVFHVADAIQALCVFVLRCYRVTVAPLLVYCVLLWGVGLTGGYVLAYEGIGYLPATHSPQSFWVAGSAALMFTALVFVAILWRSVRRGLPPA